MTTGLINLRDVGGLPAGADARTRFGVLLRSDCPSTASARDATHLRETIGLRTVVDLRAADQSAQAGHGPLASLDRIALPVQGTETMSPQTRPEHYAWIAGEYGEPLAALVHRLARPAAVPVLVHCQLGQDRTGVVIALLLRLAGVADVDICRDYSLSGHANDAIRERTQRRRFEAGLPPLTDSHFAAWDPTAEVMAAALELMDRRWGGIDGWASAYGLRPVEVAAWRDVLVEPVRPTASSSRARRSRRR